MAIQGIPGPGRRAHAPAFQSFPDMFLFLARFPEIIIHQQMLGKTPRAWPKKRKAVTIRSFVLDSFNTFWRISCQVLGGFWCVGPAQPGKAAVCKPTGTSQTNAVVPRMACHIQVSDSRQLPKTPPSGESFPRSCVPRLPCCGCRMPLVSK